MQEEVTQKTIALSIKAAKLDAAILQKAVKLLLRQIQKQWNKPIRGKQTMRQLMKPGEKAASIEITDDNIKAFDPIAKRNRLDYHVKKIEGGKIPRYLVFFKGKDIDVMTEAFREFSAMKLNREKKPSVRRLLSSLKETAAAKNAERVKLKNKDRGIEL